MVEASRNLASLRRGSPFFLIALVALLVFFMLESTGTASTFTTSNPPRGFPPCPVEPAAAMTWPSGSQPTELVQSWSPSDDAAVRAFKARYYTCTSFGGFTNGKTGRHTDLFIGATSAVSLFWPDASRQQIEGVLAKYQKSGLFTSVKVVRMPACPTDTRVPMPICGSWQHGYWSGIGLTSKP